MRGGPENLWCRPWIADPRVPPGQPTPKTLSTGFSGPPSSGPVALLRGRRARSLTISTAGGLRQAKGHAADLRFRASVLVSELRAFSRLPEAGPQSEHAA